MGDWMLSDDIRYKVVTQSLESRRALLRSAAAQCRLAYSKDYMKIPMTWLAEAYDEAACLLDSRLRQIDAARRPEMPAIISHGAQAAE